MKPLGYFSFVLHSHLPYCRGAGRWPHGEEWIYEAASETYLPLLDALSTLDASTKPCLTISLTPVLVEQLSALPVQQGIRTYIADRRDRAISDGRRFTRDGDARMLSLSEFYRDWFEARLRTFDTLSGDLIGAFSRLQNQGRLEIITCSATHAYLPLLTRDSSVYAQVHTGVESYRRTFGCRPSGFWLPECAYRSKTKDEHGTLRPGLEEFLATQGIRFFFVETHAIEGGEAPTGLDHLAPWYNLSRGAASSAVKTQERSEYTTFLPYFVGNSTVAAIGRNRRLSMQVWSADTGYPGDPYYREFHKRDATSGLQYWRISGRGVDLGAKNSYDPLTAQQRVAEHARHFVNLVIEELTKQRQHHGVPGLVTAVFDTELFGHWWFEGIDWLKLVLQMLSTDERVGMMPISQYLGEMPPRSAIDLPESSWGAAGDSRTWFNDATKPIWSWLNYNERPMEQLSTQINAENRRFILQAGREMLLAQSSDWPFLVSTGQARQYAQERFQKHCERFQVLNHLAKADSLSSNEWQYLSQTEAADQLFSFLEPTWFAARQGSSS